MTTAAGYIGIDVAKATLAVATSTQFLCEVENTPTGHQELITRLSTLTVTGVVLEATGVYGQAITEALMLAGYAVAVVQPGCVRHFAKSENLHAKTDAIDAMVIARFAAGRKLRFVQKTPDSIVHLRALIDRRDQIILIRISEENHLESNRNTTIQKEIKANIKRFEKQEKEYTKRIADAMAADQTLTAKRKILENESGIGTHTAAVLLAHLPELGSVNRQEIAALVGLAPYNHDSGTMRGKRAIYGGRQRLRKALYLAALSATRWSEWLKNTYAYLLKRGKCKKVALIACARKLIIRLNSLLAAASKTQQQIAHPTKINPLI
jgi:transposase